jgi:hypothetical protein
MSVFSTPEEVALLKERSLQWEKDGFPGADEYMAPIISLLNQLDYIAPVYSCTGHAVRNPDTTKTTRTDFYLILAVQEEGFPIVAGIYKAMMAALVQKYTREHIAYKEHVAKYGEKNPKHPAPRVIWQSRPNGLRLTFTNRVWPISIEGGTEKLHDGDTHFYNVMLLAGETGYDLAIKNFMWTLYEVVQEVVALAKAVQ